MTLHGGGLPITKGRLPLLRVLEYVPGYYPMIPVFQARKSRVNVLAVPLNLCGDNLTDCTVVFHYTNYRGLVAMADPQLSKASPLARTNFSKLIFQKQQKIVFGSLRINFESVRTSFGRIQPYGENAHTGGKKVSGPRVRGDSSLMMMMMMNAFTIPQRCAI